jgi:hypothetical protein
MSQLLRLFTVYDNDDNGCRKSVDTFEHRNGFTSAQNLSCEKEKEKKRQKEEVKKKNGEEKEEKKEGQEEKNKKKKGPEET